MKLVSPNTLIRCFIKEKIMIVEKSFQVKGMHCESCAKKIEDALRKFDGIKSVEVSLKDDNVKVKFDADKIQLEVILKEIEKEGYIPIMSSYNEIEKQASCCDGRNTAFKSGLLAGLLSHSFCIAFIIFSVLGATTATYLLRPFLLNPYFFYILIALSFVFASASAFIYFKRQGIISLNKVGGVLEINFDKKIISREICGLQKILNLCVLN